MNNMVDKFSLAKIIPESELKECVISSFSKDLPDSQKLADIEFNDDDVCGIHKTNTCQKRIDSDRCKRSAPIMRERESGIDILLRTINEFEHI